MIFVTTGTHEQQFNRLVGEADRLAALGTESYFIQYGYHTQAPVRAAGERLIAREKMESLIREARIVITHGGPGSIWACFDVNKIPIVVPRQYRYAEHVNDHQVLFCRRLAASKRVLLVENIADLPRVIENYGHLVADCAAPAGFANKARQDFCRLLGELIQG